MDIYKRLDRKLVHKGKIIDLYEDTVAIPNGNVAKWDFIGHKGAAAVVPVTADGRILMVHQYRNALDRETLEIPAGGRDSVDEPYIDCAARELEEETGYKTEKENLAKRLEEVNAELEQLSGAGERFRSLAEQKKRLEELERLLREWENPVNGRKICRRSGCGSEKDQKSIPAVPVCGWRYVM